MFKYIIQAIAGGLSFSKTEARGTFVLGIAIVLAAVASRALATSDESQLREDNYSAELAAWVKEVEGSVKLRAPKPKPIERARIHKIASAPTETREPSPRSLEHEVVPTIEDINDATSADLQKIRGIGPAYSERIIKYRDLLGGFAHMEQLKEVYGLSPEVIERIEIGYEVRSQPSSFPINSDSAKALAGHPYISYDQAWTIINYRRQHGDISNFEELTRIKSLDDSLLLKLRPYIK